jgi:glycosyltransferase involved in cell wall biosynthesis
MVLVVKVSVVIPVYNTEKYVGECLDSLLAQTLSGIEIICINDGSTDGSLEVLRNYKEQYPQVKVLDQPNKGQSAARNAGLQIAQGKYVYFMDSDDLLEANAFEELYATCEHHELDVVYFSGKSFFETPELEAKHQAFANNYSRQGAYGSVVSGQEMLALQKSNSDFYVSPCLQFLRRDFLLENNISFYEGIIHEDNLFSFQVILLAQKAFCVAEVYFYRRMRPSSVMTSKEGLNNAQGYCVCYFQMVNFAGALKLPNKVEEVTDSVINSILKAIMRIYPKLSIDEQKQLTECISPSERRIFNTAILSCITLEKSQKTTIAKKCEALETLKNVKNSRTYRVGKFITAPLRALEKIIRKKS